MDMVFGLGGYRGIQPAGLLPGPDRSPGGEGPGQKPILSLRPEKDVEIYLISEEAPEQSGSDSTQQELLDGYHWIEGGQAETPETAFALGSWGMRRGAGVDTGDCKIACKSGQIGPGGGRE